MQFRTVLTLVNLAAFLVAILVLEVFPQYATIAFYGLVGWMVVSLALLYGRSARPSTAAAGGGGGPGVSPDAPLASTASPTHASYLGFCMYCAAPIEPNTARCPACGHALPHL